MNAKIPDISNQVYKEEIQNLLISEYSTLGSVWVNQQMEWMNGTYTAFKNHDKFLIIIYLLKKALDFYSRSFIKLSYEEFYQNDNVTIDKFSIAEISYELNIPKESARRKIRELEDLGVIKKSKKNIIIDRSSFGRIKPVDTIIRISRFLSILTNLCVDEKILKKKIESKEFEITIKKNFSYIWKTYYELQIPMMLTYKKVFIDLETFHIFGTCVVNQHLHTQKLNKLKMSRDIFLDSLIQTEFLGINAMSISDITNIPRATVIRKLRKLVKNQVLIIDKKKLYRLSGYFSEKMKPTQKIILDQLAIFSTKIINLAKL